MSELATSEPSRSLPVVAGTDAVLDMFERAIRDPTVDMTKMRSIMDMHREIREEKAEEEFADALVAVKAELPKIARDAKNSQTNSTYARLETIGAAIDPIIARHGISLSFGMADSPLPNHYRIVCEIRRKGFKKTEHVDIAIDGVGPTGIRNKSATHAAGSTLSYGRRYLKLMIFDIALTNEDDDGNGGAGKPSQACSTGTRSAPVLPVESNISFEQVAKLRKALDIAEWQETEFLAHINLPALSQIYAKMFGRALNLILARSVGHAQ